MGEIDYGKIPDWWVMCQKETCPKAGECLRYQACVAVPKEVTSWQCLLPQVLDDEECRYFLKMETVRMARGLNKLFSEVQHRRSRQDIRAALLRHFGSNGSYYRYKDGESRPIQRASRRRDVPPLYAITMRSKTSTTN